MNRSREDIRSTYDLSTIINNLRNVNVKNIPETKWNELLIEQDFDNYIFELREDLLSRVFDEIKQKFLEEKRVKFTVECAYESWKQIICLNFLFYDPCDEFYKDKSSWTPDPEPEVCRPDSWNRGNILTNKEHVDLLEPHRIETVLSDYQIIKLDEYPTENYFTQRSKSLESSQSELESFLYENEGEGDLNMMYTSPASSCHMPSQMIINTLSFEPLPPIKSEEKFCKSIKRTRSTICESVADYNILPMKKITVCGSFLEEKKFSLPPLRLNVNTTLRRLSAVSGLQSQHRPSSLRQRIIPSEDNSVSFSSSNRISQLSENDDPKPPKENSE